jgi:hypothetical protein
MKKRLQLEMVSLKLTPDWIEQFGRHAADCWFYGFMDFWFYGVALGSIKWSERLCCTLVPCHAEILCSKISLKAATESEDISSNTNTNGILTMKMKNICCAVGCNNREKITSAFFI